MSGLDYFLLGVIAALALVAVPAVVYQNDTIDDLAAKLKESQEVNDLCVDTLDECLDVVGIGHIKAAPPAKGLRL